MLLCWDPVWSRENTGGNGWPSLTIKGHRTLSPRSAAGFTPLLENRRNSAFQRIHNTDQQHCSAQISGKGKLIRKQWTVSANTCTMRVTTLIQTWRRLNTLVDEREGARKGTGHTHADGPRRNTLTALLCSSVCWGHLWDLVGHKVALYIPNWRPSTAHSFTPSLHGYGHSGTDGCGHNQ